MFDVVGLVGLVVVVIMVIVDVVVWIWNHYYLKIEFQTKFTDGQMDGRTNREMDGPTDIRTNGRTNPHLKMLGRI